jgi:uncharacterized phage protein (TIGR01671 family)
MKNREIKFRAYFGGIMYYSDSQESAKLLNIPLGKSIIGGFMATFTFDETLMQFTGLYDKNGKEIYEGDIVKRPSSNGTLEQMAYGRIVFQRGCFKILWKDKKLSGIYDNLYYHDLDCEIIGNLHQHPELLK